MAKRLSTGLRNKLAGIVTNLISNGTFASGTTGWTGSGATLTTDATGGEQGGSGLKITNSGAAAGKAYTDITTVVGRTYLIDCYVDAGDAGGIQILVGTTSDDDAVMTSPVYTDTTIAQKRIAFVATATTTRITAVVGSTTSGQFVLLDSVVVEEQLDGLRGIFRNAKVNIYTGTQPTSPDDAATGTLLVTISKDGGADGIIFDSAASGAITKPSGETWEGTFAANGSMGWARVYEEGDSPGSSSSTAARYDLSIGTSGADANFVSVTATSGAKFTVSNFTLTIPATA